MEISSLVWGSTGITQAQSLLIVMERIELLSLVGTTSIFSFMYGEMISVSAVGDAIAQYLSYIRYLPFLTLRLKLSLLVGYFFFPLE